MQRAKRIGGVSHGSHGSLTVVAQGLLHSMNNSHSAMIIAFKKAITKHSAASPTSPNHIYNWSIFVESYKMQNSRAASGRHHFPT